jgi:synaptojanin
MRVLLKERPRALTLVSGDYALTFRYLASSNPDKRSKCIVEFVQTDSLDMGVYRLLSHEECFGFLGLIEMEGDVYLCCITRKALAASPRPHETVYRIYGVEFYCLNKPDWDFVILDANGIGVQGQSIEEQRGIEHPCANLRKILSNGSFYYSANFDLTSPLQNR